MNKIFAIVLLMTVSQQSIAAKGFLFKIGESLIKLDGFSYEELEKKNKTFLDSKRLCEGSTSPISEKLIKTNKKLIGCERHDAYKLYPNERNIGYNVIDILNTGCRGLLKFKKEVMKPDSTVESTETVTNIITKRDKTFKHLVLLRDKKHLFKVDSEFMDTAERQINEFRIESLLNAFRPGTLPSLVLGRVYTNQGMPNHSGFPNSIYQYNVMENESKKLEVILTGQYGSQGNGNTSITSYEMYCTAMSVAELESFAKTNDDVTRKQEIRNKLFGK